MDAVGACAACARVPAVRGGRGEVRAGRRIVAIVAALLFLASAAATVAGSLTMSAMGGMPMPGGWTASMMWMRMCGEAWSGVAASFVGMWTVMMVAMMLPSLLPMLWRYRRAVNVSSPLRLCWLTAQVGLGYFLVWSALGAAVFPLGAALVALAMRVPMLARAVPAMTAGVVLIAGALQFTRWKMRCLAGCSETPMLRANVRTAWRHGLHLGFRCCRCCAGPMAALLVVGVMDVSAMAVATAAITAERLARNGRRAARIVGAVGIAVGLALLVRAAGAG
jgi:predicted metal-binding membrane protein